MSRRSRTRAEPTWLRPGIGWRSGRGVRNAPCEPKGELEGELEGEPEMAGGREGADGGVSARARAVDLRGEKPDTAQGWGGREVGTSAGMSREAHHYARGAARGRGPYHHAATIEVVEEGAGMARGRVGAGVYNLWPWAHRGRRDAAPPWSCLPCTDEGPTPHTVHNPTREGCVRLPNLKTFF